MKKTYLIKYVVLLFFVLSAVTAFAQTGVISGKVLDEDVVKTRVKVGVPVRVHYTGTGDAMMVDRVILDED